MTVTPSTTEKNPITPSMMIYVAIWEGHPTFKMLPLTADCPFNEVIFDPRSATLAIVAKDQKERLQLIEKLDELGNPVPDKKRRTAEGEPVYLRERKPMKMYYEYFLQNKQDVQAFVDTFAVNPQHPALDILKHAPLSKGSQQEGE
jgi:hypothetical protein